MTRHVRQKNSRTRRHHPDLREFGHRFDDDLECKECGREYFAMCAEPAQCLVTIDLQFFVDAQKREARA